MPELRLSEAAVVQCLGRPSALDALETPSGAGSYRVAPDELLVVGAPSGQSALVEATRQGLEQSDPDALVIDMSDGWSIVSVHGPAPDYVLRRLSAVAPPDSRPAFVQASIAEAPARAIVLDDAVHLLVSATVAHHVRARVLAACEDLGIEELDPAPLGVLS